MVRIACNIRRPDARIRRTTGSCCFPGPVSMRLHPWFILGLLAVSVPACAALESGVPTSPSRFHASSPHPVLRPIGDDEGMKRAGDAETRTIATGDESKTPKGLGDEEKADSPHPIIPTSGHLGPAEGGHDKTEDPAAPPEPGPEQAALTLDVVEQMALENNPTLRQLSATVDKAEGVRLQVGLPPNPTIGYSGDEIGNDGAAGQQGGFVSQTIVTGDKLQLNRAVAGHDVQALLWELEAQRYRVLTDVRLGFYDVLGAQRRVELARELVQVAEAGAAAAQELFRAEQASRADVLQAQVQLNEVRIILQNAEVDVQAARRRLAALAGEPQLDTNNLAGTLEADLPERPWESTYEELLAASPELQAASARVNRARTQIRRQEAQPIPNLLAQVGVAHDHASGDDIASVQLGLPLPLFNRNQGNIDVAVAEYHRALDEVTRLELSLRSRLAVSWGAYQKARQQVDRYRQDILPQARENLDLTETGYQGGEFDFLRVLTARRTFFEANLAYVQALIDQRQAEAVINGLLLTGGLSAVPDVSTGLLGGPGQRDQALGGQ